MSNETQMNKKKYAIRVFGYQTACSSQQVINHTIKVHHMLKAAVAVESSCWKFFVQKAW